MQSKLGEAVLGTEQVAKLQVEIERQREEQQRRWAEEDRKREIARIREQHELELAKDLLQMSNAWHESRDLRAFLDAVEQGTPEEMLRPLRWDEDAGALMILRSQRRSYVGPTKTSAPGRYRSRRRWWSFFGRIERR